MEKNNNNSNNIIELKNIVKTYDNGFTAVDGFNLEVKRGEFVVLRPFRLRKNHDT